MNHQHWGWIGLSLLTLGGCQGLDSGAMTRTTTLPTIEEPPVVPSGLTSSLTGASLPNGTNASMAGPRGTPAAGIPDLTTRPSEGRMLLRTGAIQLGPGVGKNLWGWQGDGLSGF